MYNDYDDYDDYEEMQELPQELSYEFASNEVFKELKKKWKSLKEKLQKQEDTAEDIDEFDKLINYYIYE